MILMLAFIGLIVLAILATVLTETENFGWATLVLIVSVVAAQWLHVVNFIGYVSAHGVASLLYALAYVGIGVVWSFVKWFSFLMGARGKYREYKVSFLNSIGASTTAGFSDIPADKLDDFKRWLAKTPSFYAMRTYDPFHELVRGERPRASKNKARITTWMCLWPCSMIGTALNDPVRRLFNFLFSQFKALYQKLADYVFANDVELK
jgi:hypothetical protein